MMRNAWHLSGGEGWYENTTCLRVLVVHTNGTQSVQEIKNSIGLSRTDIEGMRRKLIEQGVTDIAQIKLTG